MKKRIIIFLVLIPILSGCEGNITRDIRHAGFTVSENEFECEELISEKDTELSEIIYIDDNYAINKNNEIYQISLNQKYSNDKNCKKSTSIGLVKATIDNQILKSEDNKLYYAPTTNTTVIEITQADENYALYSALTSDPEIIKIITLDSSLGIYYILKKDGNVYEYIMPEVENTNTFKITSTKIVYDAKDYDGRILDFNYTVNNQNAIFVKTENTYYRMLTQNEEECTKYADVSCIYEIERDQLLNDNKESIIHYNGSILYTDYNKIFTM